MMLPYRGKLLADLANDHKFAKVSLAKILCSILNNIINVAKVNLPNVFL